MGTDNEARELYDITGAETKIEPLEIAQQPIESGSFQNLVEAAELFSSAASEMAISITDFAEAWVRFSWQLAAQYCQNRKVRHLMRYAKKRRVRKKNFNRAIKIIEKGRME